MKRVWAWVLFLGLGGAGAGFAVASASEPAEDTGGYSYQPGGRRDPFLRGGTTRPMSLPCAARDLAGIPIQDVALRGVVLFDRGPVALLLGPDQRTHFARTGDRLCDGRITAIGPSTVRVERDAGDGAATREVVHEMHP